MRSMDPRYFDFCPPGTPFYDRMDAGAGFAVADRVLPPGWRSQRVQDWIRYRHDAAETPPQGWKIHVSTVPDRADAVLAHVWDCCVRHRVPFQHLAGARLLLSANARHAARGSSGTFATIYPAGEEQLRRVLEDLDARLAGWPGPYVLSDLRYGDGPLFVRYGGFAGRRAVFDRGVAEPAIEDPSGGLVPDRREPVFRPPPWVGLPGFLAPHLAARDVARAGHPRYDIQSSWRFSNGGAVHLGADRTTGERVVLKEARPHAGLDAAGADAVRRLHRERRLLRRLAGTGFAPGVRDMFVLGEHHVLVLDFLEGVPLDKAFGLRYPLNDRCTDPARLREHVSWAAAVVADVERNVAALHGRGVVFGDLHPRNILVRPDRRTALVDFQAAFLEGVDPVRADAGFAAPADRQGFEVDRYALACLRLWMFLPITGLLALEPGTAGRLAAEIATLFPIPPGYLDAAVSVIDAGIPPAVAPPASSMPAAIRASATPARRDRLFPGDIEQFAPGGGACLAYGAAGVLYALAEAGEPVAPEHVDWLAGAADGPPGLYDGLSGVAYVLDRLGRRDRAAEILDRVRLADLDALGADLFGGLAGIGLALDHFGDPAAAHYAALARQRPSSGVGLLRGGAGVALLCLRRFERTGDEDLLDAAAALIDRDLARCAPQPDGSLQVDDGRRPRPYLDGGSIGIGLVLRELLPHRPDLRHAEALRAIVQAAWQDFAAQPGLFNGRAGALLLSDAQARRLDWHAISYAGHRAFPGEHLLRLSMDLATGTAGVLLATSGATLPFLTRTRAPAAAHRAA